MQWSPTQCLLGEHVVWERRKADSLCHNPVEREVRTAESPCECTEQDYECDYCFERNATGGCSVEPTTICRAYAANPHQFCALDDVEQVSRGRGLGLEKALTRGW